MSTLRLRTRSTEPAPDAPVVLLDAFEGQDKSSTVQLGDGPRTPHRDIVELPVAANDLLWLSIGVLGADSTTSRARTADGWTRDIEIEVGLADPRWAPVTGDLERMLGFLTGDRWTLRLLDQVLPRRLSILRPSGDTVCLLSGGLDSLSGAVDLLSGAPDGRVVLVGAHDSGASAHSQRELGHELESAFPGRVTRRRTWATMRRATTSQLRPLPAERENTTRSRSFYFIAAGIARAALLGAEVPLHVPENGVIGVNVPVSPSRPGSLSTRTTHPFFMASLARILAAVGITNPIVNPYRLMTKGEALAQSRDLGLLLRLTPQSVSCAHPSALRYRGCAGPCGYCYPCLIRRASLHAVGADGPGGYCINVLAEAGFVTAASETNASLLAVLDRLHRGSEPGEVLRTGPIAPHEAAAFADLHRRGVEELDAWLRTATAPDLVALLP